MQDEKLVLPIVSFSFLISTPSKMTKQSDMAKILKSEEFYPLAIDILRKLYIVNSAILFDFTAHPIKYYVS